MAEVREIRVLITKENGYWVAQCLEYDIGVQSLDPDKLPRRLAAAIEAERQQSLQRHGKAFAGISPAPEHFFREWDRRVRIFKPSECVVLPYAPEIKLDFALAA